MESLDLRGVDVDVAPSVEESLETSMEPTDMLLRRPAVIVAASRLLLELDAEEEVGLGVEFEGPVVGGRDREREDSRSRSRATGA